MKIEFLEAGQIVTTHGIKGDVKVLPWSDGPDFLMDFKRVRIACKEYAVESCRVQKTCNLVKLRGVDTVEAAQLLIGKTVEVFRCDAPADMIFVSELIGVEVRAGDEILGEVVDVLDYPGNKVYVVEGKHSYMIPAVKEFILSTDMDAGIMQVKVIEGMRTDED